MNFSNSLCIAYGPRAGLPRPVTDIVMDQQSAVWRTTVRLKRNGFEVLGTMVNATAQPSIHVLPGAQTDEMIALGQAVYYRYGKNADGVDIRYGQFQIEGVRVVWVELGARA